ncbi:MAG: SWIM zinc finger family protein [Planctomycetes bacterium]|nr:SWIM zinc finger family protein [Planctomycetota bacterium]
MSANNHIEILAKSSSGNPYTVRFYLEEDGISAFCSCPAGDHRKLCKHVIRLINGDDSILYDGNQKQILLDISTHLQGTAIPVLLSELNESEILLENARKNARKAKKTLEKVVLGK